jgi:hypothetical protein
LNVAPQADPSAPANGDVWISTTSNVAKARINSATKTILTSPIARTDEPTVGQQISSSSGTDATFTNTSFADITNLTVTITTTGRPVIIAMQPDGTTNGATWAEQALGNQTMAVRLLRGASEIARWTNQVPSGAGVPPNLPANLWYLDAPAAGTYTYKLQGQTTPSGTYSVLNCVLVAYEL